MAGLLVDYAPETATAQRLVAQLRACQVSALAFCRLLERWARGDAAPSTAGAREAALRRAAERAETALTGLGGPLGALPARAGGRPGRGTLVVRRARPSRARRVAAGPDRAGVHASPVRVAQAYLELAVLVRALEGLATAARMRSAPEPSDLWAGLFDLRENLLNGALDDLRALAA